MTDRQSASLDQFGAYCRDSRKELLRLAAELRRDDTWWTDPHKLHTVCLYMVDQCSSMDEIRRVIGWVLSTPWRYRVEYVISECIKRDARVNK